MPTLTDKQELLRSEGCPWAKRDAQELYLGINDHLADFGFAFGHGEFNRESLEEVYLGRNKSNLAEAIAATGLVNPGFEVRVEAGLEFRIGLAIRHLPATSWEGWAWDVARMANGACSWEFCAGEVLYGMSIEGETHWLVSGLMDPGMWCEGEGWLTFALAEDVLPHPETGFAALSYDSITNRAFGSAAE